jgi:hypothetical protein
MKRSLLNWLAFACIVTFFFACESDEKKNAKLQVWLTDAPGDYQEVKIDVQGVEIHASENDDGKGWTSVNVKTGIYDLLELTNGLDTLLGEVELPAGKISQIRLKLGDNNSLVTDGQTFDLSTPSAQQSGLKLQIHQTLEEGITYKILLDFDVARSIVKTGNGNYKLKPVIRTITEAQSGAIKGVVDPKESTPAVYAITGDDTVGTTYANEAGQFLLKGIPAGTYRVTFEPNTGYEKVQKEGVTVQTGTVSDVGTVTIPAN